MLSPSARPRAPSVATLRVLYQLAYISSGTAVGVGVLCAEERRRRIKTVQRIADNAHRLRQCSRYNHHAAAALQEEGAFDHVLYENERWDNSDRASLGPDAPSIVEDAYRRIAKKADKLKRSAQNTTANGEGDLQSGIGSTTGDFIYHERPGSSSVTNGQQKQEIKARIAPWTRAITRTITAEHKSGDSTPWRAQEMVQPNQQSTMHAKSQIQTAAERRRAVEEITQSGTAVEQTTHSKPATHSLGKAKEFATASYWPHSFNVPAHSQRQIRQLRDRIDSLEADAVLALKNCLVRDVSLLVNVHDWASSEKYTWDTTRKQDFENIARHLSQLALELNCPREVAALHLWQLTRSHLEQPNPRSLKVAWYAHIKFINRRKESMQAKGHRIDGIADEASSSRTLQSLSGASDAVWQVRGHRILHTYLDHCRKLFQHDALGAAVLLLTSVTVDSLPRSPELLSLARDMFLAAVTANDFEACKMLLAWSGGLDNAVLSARHIDSFVQACGRQKGYDDLRAIFTSESFDKAKNIRALRLDGLSSQRSLIQICHAFVDEPTHVDLLFQICHKRLSPQNQGRFLQQYCAKHVAGLAARWRRTQSFQAALDEYNIHLERPLIKTDATATKQLHIAMIRICLAAGQSDKAEEAIERLGTAKKGADGHFLAMLSCACQSDWQVLDQLVNLHAKRPLSKQHPDISRRIIKLFVNSHDASEVFSFALRWTDVYSQMSVEYITGVLLEKFAAEQRIDLMKHWLQLCRNRRWRVDLNGDVVARILHNFSVATRTNHSLIMGTAHRIGKLAPGLVNKRVRNVVREALHHDLRLYSQLGDTQKYELAHSRLQSFLQSPDKIPDPNAWQRHGVEHEQPTGIHIESDLDFPAFISGAFVDEDIPGSLEGVHEDNVSRHDSAVGSDDEGSDTAHDKTALLDRQATRTSSQISSKNVNELMIPLPQTDSRDIINASKGDRSRRIAKSVSKADLDAEILHASTLKDWPRVLSIFRDNCSADGLPHSHYALKCALAAHISLDQITLAYDILDAAENAGMDTTFAIEPLLLARVKEMATLTSKSAVNLSDDIIKYYQHNDRNGHRISHQLAVLAASKMIDDGLPKQGVHLLRVLAVLKFQTVNFKNVMVMAVMLKGHIAMHDYREITQLVDRMLEHNTRIDIPFLATLRIAETHPSQYDRESGFQFSDTEKAELRRLRQLCKERMYRQRAEASYFLPWLTWVLVKHYISANKVDLRFARRWDYSQPRHSFRVREMPGRGMVIQKEVRRSDRLTSLQQRRSRRLAAFRWSGTEASKTTLKDEDNVDLAITTSRDESEMSAAHA